MSALLLPSHLVFAPLHACLMIASQDAGGFSSSKRSYVLSLLIICVAGEFGWPTSSILNRVPETDEEKTQLIDTLQDWKTLKYQEIVCERASQSFAHAQELRVEPHDLALRTASPMPVTEQEQRLSQHAFRPIAKMINFAAKLLPAKLLPTAGCSGTLPQHSGSLPALAASLRPADGA